MGLFFSRESFEDGTEDVKRPPLCCGGGMQALNWAERIDGYLAAVAESELNMKARSTGEYKPAEFSQEGRTIPVEEKSSPWPNGQVVWMDQGADAGLPHTRPPYYICLPTSIDLESPAGLATLKHERIHVSQRLHEDTWKKIYADAWNFVPVLPPELPERVRRRIRINPDTCRAPVYAWVSASASVSAGGQWIPYALFNSSFDPKLTDTTIHWWHIQSANLYSVPPPGWSDFFGRNLSSSAHEHPNELAAYILTSTQSSPARSALEKYLDILPRTETW